MNKSTYISQGVGLIFLVLLTLFSCARIELLEKGSVTLTADWSAVDQSLDVPASYSVKINNQVLQFTSSTNSLPDLFPDRYVVWLYNHPDRVKVQGSKAIVGSDNGVLNGRPGWLFTALGEVTYENNKTNAFTLKAVQQIRQLRIKLSPAGSLASRIQAIQGVLSGVAGTWDFEKQSPEGDPMAVPLDFKKQSDGSWVASMRVLGKIGDNQQLSGKVSFDDEVLEDILFDADLSSELTDLNQNKEIPKTLSATLETKTEAGFSVTLNNWEIVQESGTAW